MPLYKSFKQLLCLNIKAENVGLRIPNSAPHCISKLSVRTTSRTSTIANYVQSDSKGDLYDFTGFVLKWNTGLFDDQNSTGGLKPIFWAPRLEGWLPPGDMLALKC